MNCLDEPSIKGGKILIFGLMENMTWKEVEEAVKQTKTVIIPFGSTEEHGYHLPLSTDYLIAYEIGKMVAEKVKVLVAPPITYGVCRTTASFPGTITISLETIKNLTKEICKSFCMHGFKNLILLPGHLGSAQLTGLELAAQETIQMYPNLNIVLVRIPYILQKYLDVVEDKEDLHAGEVETSLMLVLKPDLVKKDKIVSEHPKFPEHFIVWEPRKYMKSGVMGSAEKASKEKGEALLKILVDEIISLVKKLEQKI